MAPLLETEAESGSDYESESESDDEDENFEANAGPPDASMISQFHAGSALKCPAGHGMRVKVAREVWRLGMVFHYRTSCRRCRRKITSKDGRHTCKTCKYSLCMQCAMTLEDTGTQPISQQLGAN